MRPQEVIAKKRDGAELSEAEINSFISGVCSRSWADYQISALLMAMFIRGLSTVEQDLLTNAMLHTGEVLNFFDIKEPKGDKHSTGGVGDKTSLVIAPLAAACGIAVPMISGRGLGHTGGTLDKLEAISGYNVQLSKEAFRRVIKACGFAMAGQTAEIAPADKKIYALRDATATVPYIPLIVASIMSKKMAEGLDALVLDVKTGSGAFMQKFEDSKTLAEALVATGNRFGVKTQAIVSDMSQPLGKYVGNSFETYECLKILRGETLQGSESTQELSLELTARLLVLAGIAENREQAITIAAAKLASGEALEKFRQNVELQGGSPNICDRPESVLNNSLSQVPILAERSGFIAEIDTLAIGNAVVAIGGGRTKAEDLIDHAVGYGCGVRLGDEVQAGDEIGVLYCWGQQQADQISAKLRNAYKIAEEKPEPVELVKTVI